MAASEPQLDRIQDRQRARFKRMGLPVRAMPGGRCLLVSLPIGAAPFESVAGPQVIDRIVFSTVGADQIKCLRPRAVFGLPLLDIRRCADAAAIEETIRQAWRDRTRELRETARALRDLGLEVGAVEEGSVLSFPLPGESPETQILMQRLGEAILPGRGPLHGLALASPEERVLEVSDSLDSAADLACKLGSRLDSLREQTRARESEGRQQEVLRGPEPISPRLPLERARPSRHAPKVLIVGTRLIENEALREELTRQGYRAATARSEPEALTRLAGMTPDLVLSQYVLGRSDGATLVQTTRTLPGIERIPVVLLDELSHDSRREAARAVGAAGYVIEPITADRFVRRLGKLVEGPGKRRFTRYPERLVARVHGTSSPCLAIEVGRGGVFIATEEEIATNSAMRCEIALPQVGRTLDFEGEVLYRADPQGAQRRGLGVRFENISEEDEAALIEYLGWLESNR